MSIKYRVLSPDGFDTKGFDRNEKNQLVQIGDYKFDGSMDGVDLEISIPPKCRTEYAKIIKLNE